RRSWSCRRRRRPRTPRAPARRTRRPARRRTRWTSVRSEGTCPPYSSLLRRRAASALDGQLAAGPVDVAAPSIPHGRRDPSSAQPCHELRLHVGVARGPDRARGRVERDRVDVHPAATALVELLAEEVGAPAVVVHVLDERVLDADPATGGV